MLPVCALCRPILKDHFKRTRLRNAAKEGNKRRKKANRMTGCVYTIHRFRWILNTEYWMPRVALVWFYLSVFVVSIEKISIYHRQFQIPESRESIEQFVNFFSSEKSVKSLIFVVQFRRSIKTLKYKLE